MSKTGSTNIYTREQIQNGEGCYTNQRTAIFERPDGRYETDGGDCCGEHPEFTRLTRRLRR